MTSIPTVAGEIVDCWKLRQVERSVHESLEDVHYGVAPAQLTDAIIKELNGVRAHRRGDEIEPRLGDHIKAEIERIRDEALQNEPPTMFPSLDDKVLGLRRSDVWVVAGHSGSGKSCFADCIALNVAKQGRTALYFHWEMSTEEVTQPMLCNKARVPLRMYLVRELFADGFAKLTRAAEELFQLPMRVENAMADLEQRIAQFKAQGDDIGVVVLDYITIIKGPRASMGRAEVTQHVMEQAKRIAQEHQVALVLLSQMNDKL